MYVTDSGKLSSLFIAWTCGAVCSVLNFPERHWYTGASAASTPHHQAGQEAGAQNVQGEADRAVLAQPGEEKAQRNMRNSSEILGNTFSIRTVKYYKRLHKEFVKSQSLDILQLNGRWSLATYSN